MAEDLYGLVQHLIQEMYRPFGEAIELVRCFGEAVLAVTGSPRAEITVRSPSKAADLRLSLGEAGPARAVPPRKAVFPICYQRSELGRLAITASALPLSSAGAKACEWITKSLVYHLKRLEVDRIARERHGREVSLVGTSEPLSRIDFFLERASQTSLPALLLGSSGSEVERIALALHLLGPTPEEAFVQVNCATLECASFEQQVLGLLHRANGGTLLLAHLDQMDLRSQRLLCEVLEVGPAVWSARQCGQSVTVRLLATANRDFGGGTRHRDFCAGLFEQLDFLRLEIEPLRNRKEDISPLIEYYLRRYACGEVPEISREFLQVCIDYDWPGDVSELSRVVARLAVMVEDERLLPQHLHLYAPQLLEKQPDTTSPRPAGEELPRAQAHFTEGALLSHPDVCHPSLQRAIDYIATHCETRLSLAEVAARSYVSSSHLAHLFQQDLGTTFTRFLSSLRVDRAKRLLLDRPWESITVIAAESGFADLRHFERTFKGAVGCTPKEFRRLSGAQRHPPRMH